MSTCLGVLITATTFTIVFPKVVEVDKRRLGATFLSKQSKLLSLSSSRGGEIKNNPGVKSFGKTLRLYVEDPRNGVGTGV